MCCIIRWYKEDHHSVYQHQEDADCRTEWSVKKFHCLLAGYGRDDFHAPASEQRSRGQAQEASRTRSFIDGTGIAVKVEPATNLNLNIVHDMEE
jgi:hypothetical protein